MQPKIVDRFPHSLVEATRSRDFIVIVNVVFRNWPELMRNVNASCGGMVIMDIIMLIRPYTTVGGYAYVELFKISKLFHYVDCAKSCSSDDQSHVRAAIVASFDQSCT